jgi:Flp pilus assembly protein TadG
LIGSGSASDQKIRGQSMVELSIALPFLILIVLALVEMGIVFASYLSLVNATREGAIFASMHPELINSTCGATPYPTCAANATNDNSPFGSTGTTSTTVWSEYNNRVSNEVFVVLGETLERGGLLNQDNLTVYRPVASSGCTQPIGAGCQITVTVNYQIRTLTSGISLPAFGRFGLPSSYQINYNMAIPIR